jgi:anti-sigma factor RsiW
MVTGTHPEDVDFFEYVEGDLPEKQRVELEVHLAACAQCAEQVARVQAGRDALRQSQFLQLPPRRREAILRGLPEQRKEARGFSISPKQLVAVLTPVAAVAAAVVVLVSTGENGGDFGDAAAPGGATASAPMLESAGGGEAEDPATASKSRRLLSVAGPADAVASELRQKGFDAEAVGNRVEVRNATRAEVRNALRARRDGSVRIVIVP